MVGCASSGQLQKKLEYMNAYDYYDDEDKATHKKTDVLRSG